MASEAEGSAPDLRIVLLGVYGAGKSSIGNAILGREAFTESRTTESEIQSGRVEDRNISIIDTPGFFNTQLTDEELQKQMMKSLDLCSPGPHVFLLIVNLEKFIEDRRNIVLKILENFGPQALKFTMVVFTGREKMSNREWMLFRQDSNFQKLVSQLINKYHEMKSTSEIKPTDITELLEKIEETVRHNKQHFNNNINLKFLIKSKYEEKNLAEENKANVQETNVFRRKPVRNSFKKQNVMETCTTNETKTASEVERTQVCEDTYSTVRRQYKNDEGDGVRQKVQSLRNSLTEFGEQNTVNCWTSSGTGKWEQKKQQIVVEQRPDTADSAKHRHTKPAERADLRIVMVGKTGAGKSATGNTILTREIFEEKLCVQSVTKKCQQKQHTVGGRVISVIDTPGLCDTSISDDDLKKEIEKCVEMSLPGPHVFLLVIRVDVRLTDEEKNTVKWIQENFGEDAARYTILLFTRGDQLNGSIKEFLDENKQINELVEQCKGGYHVFSNKDEGNPSQVSELLEKIDRMLEENGGQFYTNEMYETAQKKIKEEEERQRAEERRLKSEETNKIRVEEKRKLMKDTLTGAAVVGGTALVAATTGVGLPEAFLSLAGDAIMASCGTALMTGAAALGGAALGAVTGGAAAAFPNIQVTLTVPQEPKKTDANDS